MSKSKFVEETPVFQGDVNRDKYEYPDPTPVAVPTGLKPYLSLEERIKLCIRSELSQAPVS